jgi:hypothetical protein
VAPPLAADGGAAGARDPSRLFIVSFLVLSAGAFLRVLHILWKYDLEWEPDGYQHVVYAHSVFADPPASVWYGIDVWAKPVYTFTVGLYDLLLPSALARVPAVQLLNTFFWLFAMLIVIRLAYERRHRWATIFTTAAIGSFSYVFFRDSVTANTEPMGAFIFACALWLWHRGRRFVSIALFGLLPLVRLDAALFGVIFLVAAVRDLYRSTTRRSFFRMAALAFVLFGLPLLLWNVAGYFHTGSRTFILSYGYTGVGTYGYGRLIDIPAEFLRFDGVLFAFYVGGLLRVAIDRRARDPLLVLMAMSTALHFVILNAMWVSGVASAGLLRYFVFAYPAYLLVGASALDWLFTALARAAKALVPVTIVVLLVLTIAQLRWFVRQPEWYRHLLTAVADNRLRSLPDNPAVRSAKMVYTDRPDVLYYLRRHFRSHDVGPLQRVREPSAKGVFVFAQGWSENYSGVHLEEFKGMQQLDRFGGPWGEVVFLFQR